MKELVGTRVAAEIAGTTENTVRAAFRAKELKGQIVGARLKMERKEVLRWALYKKQTSVRIGKKNWADLREEN